MKEECAAPMIFFGEGSPRQAIQECLAHYHGERNHQGLANRIPVRGNDVGRASGKIQSRERLRGLLQVYYREAA
jgi:putative transposase